MLASKLQIYLPRRITAYFLLFGLTAIVWLSIGAVYVAHAVNQNRSESSALRFLGRASNRLAIEYLQRGGETLQGLVEQMRGQAGTDYCAVVALDGTFRAHSDGHLVGALAPEHSGTTDRWGEVIRVRYVAESGGMIDEYQAPLEAGGQLIGFLRVGMSEQTLWGLVFAGAQFAPLAFFGPACCMAAGAVLLNRMVRPVADIEQQLSQAATSSSLTGCRFSEVPIQGAAAIGWNRVVNERLCGEQTGSLRERIDQSLKKGQQGHLQTVLRSLPEGIATTDRHGQITYCNPAMAAILGVPELSGDGAPEDAAPERADIMHYVCKKWRVPETDDLFSDETRGRAVVSELECLDNGRRSVVRVARFPTTSSDATQHDTHAWTIRDITQQKLAEEMRDQFVDTATHELRTPLANIKAYAETLALADVIDVEQQKQFLNTINSEATRLARFVDDLLSVSSMEVGSLALNKRVTDLRRMLNEVLTKVKPQIEEKKLVFESSLPEKMPEPVIDKDKIATVIVNLLGNAVKYTPPEGRVAFRVSVDDQHLVMTVEDSGVGIAEDELPRVFEKFFRSSDPRVQDQTGTGLGLALSQEVVRLHGGKITAESEIDKGSMFHLVLPLS